MKNSQDHTTNISNKRIFESFLTRGHKGAPQLRWFSGTPGLENPTTNAPWFLEAAWAIGLPAVRQETASLKHRGWLLRSLPSGGKAGWAAGRTGRRSGPTWARGPPCRRHWRGHGEEQKRNWWQSRLRVGTTARGGEEASACSLSRSTGRSRPTNLSKEPYITFNVRTTSPMTVCRYSSGTLWGDQKNVKDRHRIDFSCWSNIKSQEPGEENLTHFIILSMHGCLSRKQFFKHGWPHF